MVKKVKKETRVIWKWVLIFSGVLILGGVVAIMALMWPNGEGLRTDIAVGKLENWSIPSIEISLKGVRLSEIDEGSKETKYYGNEMTVYRNGETKEYSNVEIKGRGNSTWRQPKKPYQIKFSENVDLLGLGKAKKWTLLTNYHDASHIRNDVAFTLAEMLEVPYNKRGEFVELYVDGNYRGLYYLVQKIEISKGSVDLRRENGVLFEVDNLYGDKEECYYSYFNDCLILKDGVMKQGEAREEVANEFLEDYKDAEKMLKNGDYNGAKEKIDYESFAKYYLLNGFTVNPDGFSTSFYIYRNNDNKIAAGPVWDFDYALANHRWVWWNSEDLFFSPRKKMIHGSDELEENGVEKYTTKTKIVYYLMDDPGFKKEVERVFREKMSGRKQELVNSAIMSAGRIFFATKRDSEKWGIEQFEDEVLEMIRWIQQRYDFFEEEYGVVLVQ